MNCSLSSTGLGRRMGVITDRLAGLLFSKAKKKAAPAGLTAGQWFLTAGTALMLCIPHELWNNLWGVIFALLAVLLCWRDCAVYSRKPVNPAGLGWGVWGFLLLCFISCLWAEHPLAGLRVAVFYAAGFLLAYAAMGSFRDRTARDALYALLYGTLLVTSLYGLALLYLGRGNVSVLVGEERLLRLVATLEHGINYSEFVSMALPPVLLWCLRQRSMKKRLLLTGSLLIPGAAFLLTYARTGWLGLGCAFLLMMCALKPVLLLPAAGAGAAGFFLLPGPLQERILSAFQFTNTSASGRFVLWRECMGLLREHWLTGVGLGQENFYSAYAPFATGELGFAPPHTNMGYMEMLSALGIGGLLFFSLFFFGILLRLGKRARALPRGEARTETVGLLAVFFGMAMANIPEYIWFYPRVLFLWCLLFGMALAMTEE